MKLLNCTKASITIIAYNGIAHTYQPSGITVQVHDTTMPRGGAHVAPPTKGEEIVVPLVGVVDDSNDVYGLPENPEPNTLYLVPNVAFRALKGTRWAPYVVAPNTRAGQYSSQGKIASVSSLLCHVPST